MFLLIITISKALSLSLSLSLCSSASVTPSRKIFLLTVGGSGWQKSEIHTARLDVCVSVTSRGAGWRARTCAIFFFALNQRVLEGEKDGCEMAWSVSAVCFSDGCVRLGVVHAY